MKAQIKTAVLRSDTQNRWCRVYHDE